MPLQLQPATTADISSLTEIYFQSFRNPLSLAAFPRTEGIRTWWNTKNVPVDLADPASRILKVTEPEVSGDKIIAFAKWVVPRVNKGKEGTRKGSHLEENLPEWPADADQEFCDSLFGAMLKKRHQIMGDRPYYFLEMLGTLPAYQGRGADSSLIRWGTDLADRDGVESYLDALDGGELYERFGWQTVDEVLAFNGKHKALCMVREPQAVDDHMT
ncbi:MAG: hypothetical protein M1827_004260 [Pycnora praestabilis]|nr:MAG: hypothetical protein M1827_004260 [Pycnora praestabilis]